MHTDELYMRRCLQLAHQAAGHTAPNPMVGAVVVYNGRIIGEGYHHRCGEPHASERHSLSTKSGVAAPCNLVRQLGALLALRQNAALRQTDY